MPTTSTSAPTRFMRNASELATVLSIALGEQLHSPRFKEVVQPSAKVWMHHLELREPAEVDDEVKDWLRRAYDSAG